MDGFEATKQIAQFLNQELTGEAPPKRSKIILCSAYEAQNDRQRAYAIGTDIYLTKPIKIQDIYVILDKMNA